MRNLFSILGILILLCFLTCTNMNISGGASEIGNPTNGIITDPNGIKKDSDTMGTIINMNQ